VDSFRTGSDLDTMYNFSIFVVFISNGVLKENGIVFVFLHIFLLCIILFFASFVCFKSTDFVTKHVEIMLKKTNSN
jgi:hypothetical protein